MGGDGGIVVGERRWRELYCSVGEEVAIEGRRRRGRGWRDSGG